MTNEDKLLIVARYLEGDMEDDEKETFEAQLQTDIELTGLIRQYKNIHQSLKMKLAPDEQDRQLASRLKDMNRQHFKEALISAPEHKAKTVSLRPYLKWVSIAAVLVIGLLVWAPWSSGLYEKYSFSRQMSVTERGGEKPGQLAKAAELFNKGDYKEARKLLQKEYMFNPQSPLLSYYFAITLIEGGQTYEARTLLMHLYDGESVFKYDAAFYTALAFLKEDNKAEAIIWLQKIPAGNANSAKAKELIAELQK